MSLIRCKVVIEIKLFIPGNNFPFRFTHEFDIVELSNPQMPFQHFQTASHSHYSVTSPSRNVTDTAVNNEAFQTTYRVV